jgi:transcriptional regulator with XRE-family HTH domain
MKQTVWRWGGTESVGKLLARERQRQGIAQRDLARKLDVSAPNLSRIENGADLRVSTLADLARALGLEPMLVPKHAVAAVRALIDASTGTEGDVAERGRFT